MKGTTPCDWIFGGIDLAGIRRLFVLKRDRYPVCCAAILLLFLLMLSPSLLKAQEKRLSSADSLQLEHLVELYGPGDFLTDARRALLAYLGNKDSTVVSSLLAFMSTRKGGTGWLSPAEELLARTLIVDLALLRNRNALSSLLAARAIKPGANDGYDDKLFATMLEWLRNDPNTLMRLLALKEHGEVEEQFLLLLLNAQRISGVRAIDDVNRAVDHFIEAYPDSPYGAIADRYLRLYRTPAESGAGFFVGYVFGGVVGSSSSIPGRVDGPTIGGELYLGNWTTTGELVIGRLNLRDSFTVKSSDWQPGTAVMLGGTLGLGREFRSGDILYTPFLGGSLLSVNEDNPDDRGTATLSTGLQVGLALGGMVTWRVPFDHGPQLDLRFRLSAILPGFSRYSSDLSGGIILAGFSFGFIGRPYHVGLQGDGKSSSSIRR